MKRALAPCFTLLLLAACASKSPAPADPPPRVAPAAKPTAGGPAKTMDDFRVRWQRAADAAVRHGQWSDALWAVDVLRALQPDDADLIDRRAKVQQAAQAAAADRLQRAKAALQKGDADTAWRLYLEVLAIVPGQTEAAGALRGIEHDRVKRLHLGQLSRNVLNRRPGSEASAPTAAAAAATAAVPASERNEVEHASLLAAQGELDGAIAVLKPIVGGRRPDPMARRLLADLYVRKAEGLAATDKPAANTALERALQLDPGHPRAAARLKQLRDPARSAPAAEPKAAPRPGA